MNVGQTLSKHTIIPFLRDVFARRGAEEYLGEPVTIGAHMLQAAHFAQRDGHGDIVVAAALLHDIGHFTGDFIDMPLEEGTVFMEDSTDRQHERAGAAVLEAFSRNWWWIVAVSMLRQSDISVPASRVILKSCPRHLYIRCRCRAARWVMMRRTHSKPIHILMPLLRSADMMRPARNRRWMCLILTAIYPCWNGWSGPPDQTS